MHKHKIPIGTLVEVQYNQWLGKGACMAVLARLYVVEHCKMDADCDDPLYILGSAPLEDQVRIGGDSGLMHGLLYKYTSPMRESKLTPITNPERLAQLSRGIDQLSVE